MTVTFGETVFSGLFGQFLSRLLDCVKKDQILWREHELDQGTLERNISLIERYGDAFILEDNDICSWYMQLQDAMYAALDILDVCATAVENRSNMDTKESIMNSLKERIMNILYTISIHQLPADCPLSFARIIQLINEKIKKLLEEGKCHGYQDRSKSKLEKYPQLTPKPTYKIPNGQPVIGRDDDKVGILNWIKSVHTTRLPKSLEVLAIVGMGGIGKTTLAQSVYASEKHSFGLHGWVHCSVTNNATSLLKTILSEFGKDISSDTANLNTLTKLLEERIYNKNFLLIIDDVWDKTELKWEELFNPLMGGKKGSRMIVTTRDMQVVTNIKKCLKSLNGVIAPIVELYGLGKDDMWKILKNHAFGVEETCVSQDLERIGKEIVNKLKGLPLAAKAVGSLLGPEQSIAEWVKVLESDLWNVLKSEEQVNLMPALILSYLNLPHHIKSCFKYCSLLDMDGQKTFHRQLVYQWLAHDYLQVQDSESVEEAGEKIIHRLKSMSLLTTTDSRYDDTFAQMHDLIHDMSQASGTHDHLRISDDADSQNQFKENRIRHLCLRVYWWTSLKKLWSCIKLRTLILIGASDYLVIQELEPALKKMKSLRVLTLSYLCIEELPNEIGELKQLRYLDVSGNPIKRLPPNISELNHLQTLILHECDITWHSSPEQTHILGKLSFLRYLDLSYNEGMKTLPDAITLLSDLRVLSLIGCSELRDLPEGISSLERLECLELRYCYRIGKLPDGLASLAHLQVLDIASCDKILPSNFSNLVKLSRLSIDVKLLRTISGIGKLTSLKYLEEFCIKEKPGHRIDELANLNALRGGLTIRNLKYVKSKAEAQRSLMEAKAGINDLELDWISPYDTGHTIDVENEEEVIEGLKPRGEALRGLTIKNYAGRNLPSWFNNQYLRSLQRLSLIHLSNIDVIGEGSINQASKSPKLKQDEAENMNIKNKGLPKLKGPEKSDACFWPQVRQVEISKCYKLKRLPAMPHVDKIQISDCPKLKSVHALTIVKETEISKCDKLKSVKVIEISDCPNIEGVLVFPCSLESLKLLNVGLTDVRQLQCQSSKLACLTYLSIYNCPSLLSLDLHQLPDLRQLFIRGCKNLEMILGVALPAPLCDLRIIDCPKLPMKSVLESVQRLTSLQMLQLENFGCHCVDIIIGFDEQYRKKTTYETKDKFGWISCGRETKNPPPLAKEDRLYCSELLEGFFVSFPFSVGLIDEMHLQGNKNHIFGQPAIYCDSLETLPANIARFSSLKKLWIDSLEYFSPQDDGWADVEKGKAFFNLESVQQLRIADCKALKSAPCSFFLRRLNIKGCHSIKNLYSLGGQMPHLRYLVVSYCKNLENSPKQGLTHLIALQTLILQNCPKLSNLSMEEPWSLPSSLSVLLIKDCKMLQIGHIERHISKLTSLQMLVLSNCGGRISTSVVKQVVNLFGPRCPFKCKLVSTEFSFQWLYTEQNRCSAVYWMVRSNEEGSSNGCDSLAFLVEILAVMSACTVKELYISGVYELEVLYENPEETVLYLTTSFREGTFIDSWRLLTDVEIEKTRGQLCIIDPKHLSHGILLIKQWGHMEHDMSVEDEGDFKYLSKLSFKNDELEEKMSSMLPLEEWLERMYEI